MGALIQARTNVPTLKKYELRMLVGAVPNPHHGERLPGTITEIQAIHAVREIPPSAIIPLDPTDDVTVVQTAKGIPVGMSVRAVLDKLPDTTILHLACHGKQNETNPLQSALILRDGTLLVSELMRLQLPHAFLAFLSACETAQVKKSSSIGSDSELQSLNLAATLLFAGFRSVIGTMRYVPRIRPHLPVSDGLQAHVGRRWCFCGKSRLQTLVLRG